MSSVHHPKTFIPKEKNQHSGGAMGEGSQGSKVHIFSHMLDVKRKNVKSK